MVVKKVIVATEKAPKAIGPYSAAVKAGNLVFTAGQLGIDPDSGDFVPGGIEAQTKKALENLSAVLDAAGTSLANVVKTTVFLDDMDDFSDMNGIYGQFFTENFPARSAVQAAKLPKGGLVEIEAVALLS
ncbi:MAG: RidA family protein [Anaerolineales bacterium]